MRYLFFILIPLSFISCARDVEIRYKEVLIPSKCEVVKRHRPSQSSSVVEQIARLLGYIELLEKDIEICRGEE